MTNSEQEQGYNYFLKLNKDIPEWSSREDKRKEGRKEINEKSKKYFRTRMLLEERKKLISIFESYHEDSN